ncbi:hypothetical protein [Chthonobacter rhizosphaerae]|uniref:hypothetical protein n=1 Tax=Chthonobacter rhizosphaerae TaxID=2735553 RepID=UPI0015EF96FC|nr:hypothetical protein [Chthonobacter rhizosphaerae]
MSAAQRTPGQKPLTALHVYRADDGSACAYADIPEEGVSGVTWHRIPFGTPLVDAEREAMLLADRLGMALEVRDPLRLRTGAAVSDLGVLHPQDLNASNDD